MLTSTVLYCFCF